MIVTDVHALSDQVVESSTTGDQRRIRSEVHRLDLQCNIVWIVAKVMQSIILDQHHEMGTDHDLEHHDWW